MKRFFFILLFGLFICSLAQAQDRRARTEMGEKSLDFTFHGFGDFGVTGAYVGSTPPGNTLGDSLLSMLSELVGERFIRPVYGAGMTFYVADNVGLRLGFGANVSLETTPRDTTEVTTTNLALAFSPAIEVHVANTGPVSIYTGAIFSVATAFAWQGADKNRTLDTQMGYGGGAILGAQFYPWDNVSLAAESQFGIERTSTSRKRASVSTDGPTSTRIGFTVPVRVSLSFHI